MWIERDLEDKVRSLLKQKPVVLLTGARQVGKTELLKNRFSGFSYSNLDLPSDAETADKDGALYLKRNKPPLIVDEAQYAPGLFRQLKIAVDADRNAMGRYLLTGSQKFELMKEASESLAGRVGILELETLSWREISRKYPDMEIDAVLSRGGFPELYRDLDFSAWDFYRSYIATYLERDLRTQINVGSLRDFERFLRACALRSGSLLNRSELARDVGVSPNTVNQWISVLQAANIVFLLEPWFTNRGKSLVKSPKLYFADTGLLCFLCGIRGLGDLVVSPLRGAIWETFVFAELRKRQSADLGSWSLFFYRERQLEADFLVERGGRFHLIDAKWNPHPNRSDLSALKKVAERLGEENVGRMDIACRTERSYPINDLSRALSVGDLDT